MDLRSPPAPKRISALIGCVRVSISRSSRKSRRLIQQVCCKTIRSLACRKARLIVTFRHATFCRNGLVARNHLQEANFRTDRGGSLLFFGNRRTLSQGRFEVPACRASSALPAFPQQNGAFCFKPRSC